MRTTLKNSTTDVGLHPQRLVATTAKRTVVTAHVRRDRHSVCRCEIAGRAEADPSLPTYVRHGARKELE